MRPVESPLLNLPGDLLILILEQLSLDDLKSFQEFFFAIFPPNSFSQNPPSLLAQSLPTNPRSNLIQLFNHCDGKLFHKFSFPPESLDWLRQLFVRVTRIYFQDYNRLSFEYLMVYKESVKEIDFRYSKNISNQSLDEIGRCPSLTSLSLKSTLNINDNGLQKFLKSNPQIEKLNLSSTTKFSVNIITSLSSCQNLQHLDVSDSNWFSDRLLMNLKGQTLRYIDVSKTPVQLPSVISFLKSNPHLQSIRYSRLLPLPQTLELGEKILLMQVAIRSLMNEDFQALGLRQIFLLLKTDDGSMFDLIRSAGALKRIVGSLSHSVESFHSLLLLSLNYVS
jgi:hypothetical protein